VRTTGDTAHIDTILKFMPPTRVNMGASIFFYAEMIRGFRSASFCRRVLCVICTKCTLHSNHILTRLISNTLNDFYSGTSILCLHTLASSSGINVNYDEKTYREKIELFLLSVQVS